MPRFSIWQWLGIGVFGVGFARIWVCYYDARSLLPKEIPLEKRIWRGWWMNLDLYEEHDRERVGRSIRNQMLWTALLVADWIFLMWSM